MVRKVKLTLLHQNLPRNNLLILFILQKFPKLPNILFFIFADKKMFLDVSYFEKISNWARSLHDKEAHKDKTDALGEDGIHEAITRDDGKVVDRIQYNDSYYNNNGVDKPEPNPEFSNLQFSDNDDEEGDSTDKAETTLTSVNHPAQTSSDQLVIKNVKAPTGKSKRC